MFSILFFPFYAISDINGNISNISITPEGLQEWTEDHSPPMALLCDISVEKWTKSNQKWQKYLSVRIFVFNFESTEWNIWISKTFNWQLIVQKNISLSLLFLHHVVLWLCLAWYKCLPWQLFKMLSWFWNSTLLKQISRRCLSL